MAKKNAIPARFSEEAEWLGRVNEVRFPIDPLHPMAIRSWNISNEDGFSQPLVPSPERHPYCELNFRFKGTGTQYIGLEKVMRTPGDIMLVGPGVPHYALIETFPMKAVVVYFLPILLFEMGPEGDGARILARFTSSRSIAERVTRPPKSLYSKIAPHFESMAEEFQHRRLGSEFTMRADLMKTLVEIVRWEESTPGPQTVPAVTSNWTQIEKTLRFIYSHYSEPLYLGQIAKEIGVSSDRLHALFHDTLGMSCIQYLRGYRISQAASLLLLPGARVAEVASEVGFDTFSNFNHSFRHFQGMSPREYIRSHESGNKGNPALLKKPKSVTVP